MALAQVKAVFNAARRYCVDRIEANWDKFWLLEAARQATQVREETHGARFSGTYRWARRVLEASAHPQVAELVPEDRQRLVDTALLLEAVLTEIERRVADDFPGVPASRAFLVAAGQRATVGGYTAVRNDGEVTWRFVDEKGDEARIAIWERARSHYVEYVAQLRPEEATLAPAVPFRQVMSESKRQRIGPKLATRWDADPLRH